MKYVSSIQEISITKNTTYVIIYVIIDPDTCIRKKNIIEVDVYANSGSYISYGIFNVKYEDITSYLNSKDNLIYCDEDDAYINPSNVKIKIMDKKIRVFFSKPCGYNYLEYLGTFENTEKNRQLFKDAILYDDSSDRTVSIIDIMKKRTK